MLTTRVGHCQLSLLVHNNWPGLASEAKAICERLVLENVNKTSLSKNVSKMLVEKAMRREDEKQLRESMEGRTKVQDLVSDNLLLKDYFKEKSLTATREMFRIRTNMNELRGNFKNDKKFLSTGVLCVACGLKEEVNSHVMDCPFYMDLKQGRDFTKNMDLVNFFRDVMNRRDKLLKGN